MDLLPVVIAVVFGGGSGVVGMILYFGRLKEKIESIGKEIERVKTERGKCMARVDCEKERQECKAGISEQLSNIKQLISLLDNKHEVSREKIYSELTSITRFMGKVDQYMSQ
jgi:threonine dehydratase